MVNTKKLRGSAFVCLIFTVLWLVLMILSISKTGSIDTFEKAVKSATDTGVLFKLSYINAVFVTAAVTVFFVHLYHCCKPMNDHLSLAGLVFVPVYCVLNLVVYFSQLAVVPQLAALMASSGYPEVYRVILGQLVQGWSGSVVSVLNQMAYAVLGIPLIIFGMLLVRDKRAGISGGWLLAFSGMACIAGSIGTAAGSEVLAMGSVVGGILFLFALAVVVFKTHS